MAETTTYIQQLPENIQQYQEQLLATIFGTPAQGTPGEEGYVPGTPGLVGTPKPIAPYQIAGFSPAQQQAFQMAQQGLGAYQPYLSAAGQTMGAGIGTLGSAAGMFGPAAQAAQYFGAQQITPELAQARDLASGAYKAYDPSQAKAFMDPYQQNVTQEALKQLDREANRALAQSSSQAISAGAFGGGREGVQRAELGRNLQDIKTRRIFEDLSRNYQQAQQAAMTSQEAQQRRQLQAAGQLGQFGLGEAQLAESGLTRGLQSAGLMGQFGKELGVLGSRQMQAAQGQAGLGQLAQNLGLRDVGTMMDIGGMQQQLTQAGLDAQRMTQQMGYDDPYQRLAFASDILRGAPFGMSTIQTSPSTYTNPFAQALGAGLSIFGGLGSLKNIFGGD